MMCRARVALAASVATCAVVVWASADPWATKPGILAAYNAYSPSGDVTGQVVYVNDGVPADYDALATLGVDVSGKSVLARYGNSYRGIKPKLAAEQAAIVIRALRRATSTLSDGGQGPVNE